jgi:transposase InsO family protein
MSRGVVGSVRWYCATIEATRLPRASGEQLGRFGIIEDWRCDYNANRPHSAHGDLTPTEFALQWTTTHQPQAA